MALDTRLRNMLTRVLAVVDDHGTHGTRLRDDAQRLWRRVQRFVRMGLIGNGADLDALELACAALQLPMRTIRVVATGRAGRTSLRERAEQAAELLVNTLGDQIEESLLDRTTRLLQEMPQRSPVTDEAKLLADALNLDDFGVTGLILHAIQLSRQGEGLGQVAQGAEKREQYGYWDARLKDSFHFQPIRQFARQRLGHARQAAALLLAELAEDQPGHDESSAADKT